MRWPRREPALRAAPALRGPVRAIDARRRRSLALGVCCVIGALCAAIAPSTARAAADVDDVFVEVVDASGARLDPVPLLKRLRGARYVLLGEVHDNALHHQLRAVLLRLLLSDGVPTTVVFEQIDRQHSAALQGAAERAVAGAALHGTALDIEPVIDAGQFARKGWGWPLHRPLFVAALGGGATLAGGNLSRAEASAVVRGGIDAAPADVRGLLDSADSSPADKGWTSQQQTVLLHEVDVGHCGALPAPMLAPMALAQRARDAALALSMVDAMKRLPALARVVLIAGNGHLRRDIGVPHYLRVLAERDAEPGATPPRVMGVAFMERSEDGTPDQPDGTQDEVWFTPRAERADPCASFKPPGPLPPAQPQPTTPSAAPAPQTP
jgi:uncharacterized iron-regulated protein